MTDFRVRRITLLFILASCLFTLSFASSPRPLPLRRIAQVSDVRLDILTNRNEDQQYTKRSTSSPHPLPKRSSPREVLHSDRIRLSFRAFAQDFHLHLQPTEHLVHPDGAEVRIVSRDEQTGASIVRYEKMYAHEVRAFQGVVVHPDHTRARMAEDVVGLKRDERAMLEEEGILGGASIMLRDDGSESGRHSFEGTFSWLGNEHTIQLPVSYHSSKQEHDPVISKRSLARGGPIIHRRSDVMEPHEARALGIEVRAEQDSGCTADTHDYNSQNSLFLTDTNNQAFSTTPMSFFAMPQQLSARSLFPKIRDSANELLFGRSMDPLDYTYGRTSLYRRQDDVKGTANDSYTADIGSTQGCPSTARAVYLGVASDCTYTGRFTNTSDARISLLTTMNTVSNIYRNTFRMSLGVVQIEIRDGNTCPASNSGTEAWNVNCDSTTTIDQRLSAFSQWRGAQPANGTGLWHLLTACNSGSEVGVAWLGTLCKTDATSQGADTISGTGVSAAITQEAQVVAHEIGHNFGAIHDCASGCSLTSSTARQSSGAICCPLSTSTCNSNAAYIMSPVTRQATSQFSPCSIGNICNMLGSGLNTQCVNDPSVNPRQTLSVQQCGNGILEPGEECDAGIGGSNCCTSDCRLTSGSVCDPETSACCNDQCQFASAGTVCRAAIDTRCDTAETCTGTNSTCPADVRKNDGDSCGNGLTCATGHCTSRDLQCQQQSYQDLNFTSACSASASTGCSVTCQDPRSAVSCLILQQNFIDGTSCGYGGTCSAGECRRGSWQSTAAGWYRDNLRISIPVTIVVAILVLVILFCLIRACFGRRRGASSRKMAALQPPPRRSAPPPPSSSQGPYMSQQQQHAPPAQPYSSYNNNGYNGNHRNSNWVDPHAYNGPPSHPHQSWNH